MPDKANSVQLPDKEKVKSEVESSGILGGLD